MHKPIVNKLTITGFAHFSITISYYNVLDDSDREEWEDKARNESPYENGVHMWLLFSDEAKEFNGLVEKQNTIIENYLEEIDKKHGTKYKPTGKTRLL